MTVNASLQAIAIDSPLYEADAEYFEYSKAANPIAAQIISRVPYKTFPAALCAAGDSRVIPLDLSQELGCEGPATGPGLTANFIRLNAGDHLTLQPNATSQVLYVIEGAGTLAYGATWRSSGPRAASSPCQGCWPPN